MPNRKLLKLLLLPSLVVSVLPSICSGDPIVIEGITEPFLDVTLSVPVSGIIRAEPIKEGASVKKGQVIAELDRRLEEFEAQRRKAIMDQAKLEFESTRQLRETTKSVSAEELNKKKTDYEVAAAEYGIAAEELARRQVVAQFEGTIAEISLKEGAACAPYQAIARLVDTSRFYFVGHVDGKFSAALRIGQTVSLAVPGITNVITGKICFTSPVVDPASGLAKVKALFENPDGSIRPGLTARLAAE